MSAFIVVHVHVKNPSEWDYLEPFLLRIDDYIRKIIFVSESIDGFSFSESWKDRVQEFIQTLENPTQSLLHFLQSSSTDLLDTDWILNVHIDYDDDLQLKISEFFDKIYNIMFPKTDQAVEDLFKQIQEKSDLVGVHTYPYDYFSIKDELSLINTLGLHIKTSWFSFDAEYPQWKECTVFEKITLSILHKFQNIPLIDVELYNTLFSDASPLDTKVRLELIGQFMNPNVAPLFYYPDLLVLFRYETWKEVFQEKINDYSEFSSKIWERIIPIAFLLHKKRLQVISETTSSE